MEAVEPPAPVASAKSLSFAEEGGQPRLLSGGLSSAAGGGRSSSTGGAARGAAASSLSAAQEEEASKGGSLLNLRGGAAAARAEATSPPAPSEEDDEEEEDEDDDDDEDDDEEKGVAKRRSGEETKEEEEDGARPLKPVGPRSGSMQSSISDMKSMLSSSKYSVGQKDAPPHRLERAHSSSRSMRTLLQDVTQALHHIPDYLHHMPKWQYRLLVGSLVSLLLLFALLLSASLLYGFGMTYPRIRVADLRVSDVVLSPQVNATFSSSLICSNPNRFNVRVQPATVRVYSDPSFSAFIGSAPVAGFAMRAHQEGKPVAFSARFVDIANLPGGPELVRAYANGGRTLMYSHVVMGITVEGLGLIPMTRKYSLRCTVLHFWGGDRFTMSDCWGRFIS